MADVVIEPLNKESWDKLLEYERFTGKNMNVQYRLPRLYFFKLVIHNNTADPVNLERLFIKTRDEELDSLSLKEVKERCSSPAYAVFNFKTLLSQYRLLTDEVCMDRINFNRDVIFTRYGFIPPGDTVLRIAAFPWIPVQHREFILSLELRNNADKKIIDFKMDRLEYRTRGSYYRLHPGEKQ